LSGACRQALHLYIWLRRRLGTPGGLVFSPRIGHLPSAGTASLYIMVIASRDPYVVGSGERLFRVAALLALAYVQGECFKRAKS
jgi:hypothetical protein